ncbi:MAG: GTP-binding protein [Methanomassiliicoccales archaeon]|jgi:G3E family GTPase
MAARIAIIGGFLGAGKTTLINKIAMGLSAGGKTIGLIKNDQGEALVDTQYSKAGGFETSEVLRGCFCCRFDDLISSAREMVSRSRPDFIIAEPVGSCTDLLATVIAPLKLMCPSEFEVAPLIIVVDAPRLAQEGLDPSSLGGYLRKHQIEEAEHIVISKIDMVTRDVLLKLVEDMKTYNPQAEVIPYSAITGHGLDKIMNVVRSEKCSDHPPVDIGYETYARAEAELGWYNGTFCFQTMQKVDAYELATKIIRAISLCYDPENIAHTKLMLTSDTNSLKVSAVFDNISVDTITNSRYAEGKVTVTINARVISSPEDLRTNIRRSIFEAMESTGNQTNCLKDECFSPSSPNPTHRIVMTAGVLK